MKKIYFSQARNRALQILDKPRAGSWVSLVEPSERELDELAEDFGLNRDNLSDAVDLYESPRIDYDEGNVYIYTRYCYPEGKDIATEPLLVIYTQRQLITILRIKTGVLDRLSNDKLEFVTTQRTKTLLQVLSEVNLSYKLQLNKVSKQILKIRGELRRSEIDNREFIRIIELEEDLNEFLAALQPQAVVLKSLTTGKSIRLYEDDRDLVEDLELNTSELIELTLSRLRTLKNIRQAYDAIATNNLNATFRRLTSIAIFLTIPTIMGGLWGMNVAVPFSESKYAFFYVMTITTLFVVGVVWFFQKKRWL